MAMPPPAEAYRAVTNGVGFLDRSDRVRLDVAGPDRDKFLHNLTTNDVKRLAAGRGCEAFVTSPQGKTLGYVSLLAGDDLILVRTNPGGLELALPHLQKVFTQLPELLAAPPDIVRYKTLA
jgi:folate-binding Fe-S cluster repair protein YgfZ